MDRRTFLRSLLLCAAAPAVVSRALSAPAKPVLSTIWIAQTEDGQMHGGRMVWNKAGYYVADKQPAGHIIGTAFWEPAIATAENGWGTTARRSPVRCYGSLRPYRS